MLHDCTELYLGCAGPGSGIASIGYYGIFIVIIIIMIISSSSSITLISMIIVIIMHNMYV